MFFLLFVLLKLCSIVATTETIERTAKDIRQSLVNNIALKTMNNRELFGHINEFINSIGDIENLKGFFDDQKTDIYDFWELLKQDNTASIGQAFILYPYIQNHFLYLKICHNVEDLKKKLKSEIHYSPFKLKTEMEIIHTGFDLEYKDTIGEDELNNLIQDICQNIEPEDVKLIHAKYIDFLPFYKNSFELNKILITLENIKDENYPTDLLIDSFTDFIIKLKIPNQYTSFTSLESKKAEFKNFIAKKVFTLHDNEFKILWTYYKKFINYKECFESQRDIIKNVENSGIPKYEEAKSLFVSLQSGCGLEKYDSEDEFRTDFKNKNPYVELNSLNYFYPLYMKHIETKERISIRDALLSDISLKQASESAVSCEKTKMFVEMYKFSGKKMEKSEFANFATSMDDSFNTDHTDAIYPCYTKYADSLDIKKYVQLLKEKIQKRNIKSFELETSFIDLFNSAGINWDDHLDTYNDLHLLIAKKYDSFDINSAELIYKHYEPFLDYKKRKVQREDLLKYVNEHADIKITDIRNKINDFEYSHSLYSLVDIDLDVFKNHLINFDNIPVADINILYILYAQYLNYNEKRDSKDALMLKLKSPYKAYEFKNEILRFINVLKIESHQLSSAENLKEYLDYHLFNFDDQNDFSLILNKYKEYMEWEDRVTKRIKVVNMNAAKNKLSEMYLAIRDVIQSFELENIDVLDISKFNEHLNLMDGTINKDDTEMIRLKVIAIRDFEILYKIKKNLLDFSYLFPNYKSTELEEKILPFIEAFDLKYVEISDKAKFCEYLRTKKDNITESHSNELYDLLKKYKILKNRQTKRDSLYNLIINIQENNIKQISQHIEYFIDAYELKYNKNMNIEEFQKTLMENDDTIEAIHVEKLYQPIVNYMKFFDRRQKLDMYNKILEMRTDASIYVINKYANGVIESYLLNDEIIIDLDAFKEHIKKLDYLIEDSDIVNLQKILLIHRSKMDRIQIKDILLSFFETHSDYKTSDIFTYMEMLFSEYQLFGINLKNIITLKNHIEYIDQTITYEQIEILQPHLVKYYDIMRRRIIRVTFIEMISTKMNTSFDEISPYAKEYFNAYNILSHEFFNYNKFYSKNKEMDDMMPDFDIKFIFQYVRNYIKTEEFIKENTKKEQLNNMIHNKYDVPANIFKKAFYYFFKSLGIYPHYVWNVSSLDELSNTQKNFHQAYKSLTGIEYFSFKSRNK